MTSSFDDYIPAFGSPYPDGDWSEITAFTYETPLHLYRAIEAVQIREGEDANCIVSQPYTVSFILDDERHEITVPRGMLTDLSSVPRLARWIVGRVGPHLEASIVQDFLYIAWQDVEPKTPIERDRKFADQLMLAAMREANVGKAWLIHRAIRTFGWSAYKSPDPHRYVDLG